MSFEMAAAAAAEAAQDFNVHSLRLAVGTVALWGRVIEHRGGWRAELAYPQRVYTIDPDLAPPVAAASIIDLHPLGAVPEPLRSAIREAIRTLCWPLENDR